MPNENAALILQEYLTAQDPGFALLVNAPWGAGKTTFVKTQTRYETDQNILYLSLFGLETADAFNEALLAAFIASPGNTLEKTVRKRGEQLKNLVSGSRAFGFSVNLSSLSLLEGLREKLPPTLIFDDLERSEMPQSVLSGLLNRFIDHDRRRVILIANTDKIHPDQKPKFDTTAEKLIGRHLRVEPDVEPTLQSCWSTLKDGTGKTFLQDNQAMIRSVFEQGKHQNLRLLKRALHASVGLLEKISPELFEHEAPMLRLTRTFMALHMAHAAGHVSDNDLKARDNHRAFGKHLFGNPDPADEIQSLVELASNHPDCDIGAFHRSILSVDLVCKLLIDGYASARTINTDLRAGHHFSAPKDQPDWITLWNWESTPAPQLQAALDRTFRAIWKFELTHPGELVQTYAALDFLNRFNGLGIRRRPLARYFRAYVLELERLGKLPARRPAGRERHRYIFGHENGSVNFGGYVFEPDEVSLTLVVTLKSAMNRVYDAELPTAAAGLEQMFTQDADAFLAEISYDPRESTYFEDPILHLVDRTVFADHLLHLIEHQPETAKRVAEELRKRRLYQGNKLQDEFNWLDRLPVLLRTRSLATSRLLAAKAARFIRAHCIRR